MTEHAYDGTEGRSLLELVIKGMSVVKRDGTHVGTVDKAEEGHLKILQPDHVILINTNTSRRIGSSLLMSSSKSHYR